MNTRHLFTFGLFLTCSISLALVQSQATLAQSPRAANAWTQQAKLFDSHGYSEDLFGNAAAFSADGNTLAIGAPEYDKLGSPNPNQGQVYVYVYSGTTWILQRGIMPADVSGGDRFGSAVALSSDGNTLLAGARTQDIASDRQRGSAYVYTRSGTTWTQQKKLYAPDGAEYEHFGCAVAISSDGNTAIVGALDASSYGTTANGAAYVFTRSGTSWSTQQKLTAAVPVTNELFGGAVAISSDGNTIAVGVLGRDISSSHQGTTYIFTRSDGTWSQQQKLTATDGQNGDDFGGAVALHAETNTLVIGAPGIGAVYVFGWSGGTWTQQQKLTVPDVVPNDRFGSTIAISNNGNTLIAGAMDQDIAGNADQGAAYVFTYSSGTWSQQQKLTTADGAYQDEFGSAVALNANGSTLAVGARYAAGAKPEQGAAYVFFNPPVYPFNLYLPLVVR